MLGGARNFRDLGGYQTADGRLVRRAHVYRSDALAELTDADLVTLSDLGVRTIYDLRRDEECEHSPGRLSCVRLELPSRRVSDTDPATLQSAADGERWLLEDYLGMLANAGPVFSRLFSALAAPGSGPAVFHCTAGKDRTGLTAALLLTALGVERSVILDDYELTNRFKPARIVPDVVDLFVGEGLGRDAAQAILGAPRWAMAEALETLDDLYDGIDAYLHGPGGMAPDTLAGLRERLVSR
jgi:protein-tyrosine phosphatase